MHNSFKNLQKNKNKKSVIFAYFKVKKIQKLRKTDFFKFFYYSLNIFCNTLIFV